MISQLLLALLGHSTASDEVDLLKRVAQRDQQAFESLYDLYSRIVYSLVLSIVKKRSEAEDVLQETFMQVWEKAPTFSAAKGNVYGWLVTLARNRAIDRIRSKDFRKQGRMEVETDIEALAPAGSPDPLDSIVAAERAELVNRALQKIPSEQREVIEIAYFGGYSQSEIAVKFNIPLGTVKTRMRQGMRKLHTLLIEQL